MVRIMEMIVLPMSVLAAIAMSAPPAAPARNGLAAVPASGGAAGARSRGAEATATITARVLSSSARVGAGLGPPLPAMTPRPATITAADSSQVDALVYDFE